ncbi:MAG: DUF5336 domain-containing protein [Rhodococcus sp. (in: high G+C Gram-positive bacteria)]
MTFSPDGPRSSGPGSGGYGNYGPAGQSYGNQAPGRQSQFDQGQPPAPSQQYNPPLASDTTTSLPKILSLAVLALGVINFLIGLAGQYHAFGTDTNFFLAGNGDPTSVGLLLAAGLVAGVGLLPRQPTTVGIAAAMSIAGWLVLVFQAFNTGESGPATVPIELGIGTVAILVLGFVQSVLAVAATLARAGLIKAPRPKSSSYGQQNYPGFGQPQSGGYGQQQGQFGQYGQPQQQYGGPSQGYVPPTYSGQPSQNQPNQNTTGGLGYPVGTSNPDDRQGGSHAQPGQSNQYGQSQYGQPQYGQSHYGQPTNPVSAPNEGTPEPHTERSEQSHGDSTPPYSAPTQAFGTTPSEDDKK